MKCLSYWLCYIYSLVKLVKFLSLCYRMLCFWWIKIIKTTETAREREKSVQSNRQVSYTVETCASASKLHLVSLWSGPLTLKTFSATPTHVMNTSTKFHRNPSTEILLPSDVTSAPSLAVFGRRLKTELFCRCYNAAWLFLTLIVVLETDFLFRPL